MENKTCYLCGALLDPSDKFCKSCGAKVICSESTNAPAEEKPAEQVKIEEKIAEPQATEQKPEEKATPQTSYAPPVYGQPYPPQPQYTPYGYPYPPYMYSDPNAEPKKGSPYRPISPWAWAGINFLLTIPLVNLIILIVWSCGGTKNVTLKNYSRGYWLTVLLSFALSVVLFIIGIIIGVSIGASEFGLFDEYFGTINALNL